MPDSNGMMSPQEVEAFRLAQYLRNQQLQQAQTDPNTGLAKSAGELGGKYLGNKVGSQIFNSGSGITEASNAGWNEGANLASQEAWNAGANAAGSQVGTTAGAESMGAPLGLETAGPAAAAAIGTYLAAKAAKDMIEGKTPEGTSGKIGRAQLAFTTMGGSEILNALFGRDTTREVAKKHTKSLLSQGKDNPAWQAYVQGMRKQYEKAPTGKAFGDYDTWNEAKAAGLKADNLTGVYGNLKTFGPDWAGYGFDRQKQIVQALIDNDLYESKKGEVLVTDAAKAQALRDQILKTAAPKPSATTPTVEAPVNLGNTAPIVTFTEGVNGTKIPVFAPSPATIAKYDAINKAKGLIK